jgi:fatty acid desaturase
LVLLAAMSDQNRPTNRRVQRRREQRRLFWIVAGFLVVGGGVAIALAYGSRAVALGAACLVGGVAILALLFGILWLVEQWVK